MKSAESGKLRELDYFNAVSCLFVVLIHVLSYGISNLDPTRWQYVLFYIPHQLAAYVVPGFLFTGGVKQGLSFGREQRYFPYILRRFWKIYVPYLVWNVIYYLAFMAIHYVGGFSPAELLRYIWTGTLSSPFYYVLIVMQFYLLCPLWRWMARRVPWYAGIFLALFVTLLMTKADAVLGLFGGSFAYFDRIFPTYLVFWVVGIYVGANYGAVRRALSKYRPQVLSLGLITGVFLLIVYLSRAKGIWIYDLVVTKIFSDLASIAALLCLCLWLEESRLLRAKKLLGVVHSASFFVYLSHALFLTLISDRLLVHGITGVIPMTAARALVCYTVPFLLWWAVKSLTGFIKKQKKPRNAA